MSLAQNPAQTQPSSGTPVEITEVEQFKIKVLQQELQIQQLQAQLMGCQEQTITHNYSDAAMKLNAQIDVIKKAHGYGDDVGFNAATGQLEKRSKP